MHEAIFHFIAHYGYIGVFLSLVLGLVGLPVPDEVLMTFVGYLISLGKMNFLLTVLVALAGSIVGMSVSFFIGHNLGLPFLIKYGRKVGVTPERLDKTEVWFQRFGKFAVTIGYFLPGVRHFTAFLAGISKWSYHTFMLYAVPGGLAWVLTFVSLGYFLGEHWLAFTHSLHRYIRSGLLIILVAALLVWVYRRFLRRSPSPLQKFGINLTWGLAASLFSLGLFAFLAREVMHNQLERFDATVGDAIRSIASDGITLTAIIVTNIGSGIFEFLLLLAVALYLIIRLRHIWETVVITCCLVGAWILNYELKDIFQRSRPSIQHLVEIGSYSFPSGHAMVAAAFYGMLGYLIWLNLRARSKPAWYVIVITVLVIIAIGTSRIYLGVHFPSDVIAGFAAGSIWLVACIFGLHAIRHYLGKKKNPPL